MTVHPAYATAPSSPAVVHPSPWHTPVPYFFGGLAAVLGLIAFALMILACTYFNPLDEVQNDGDGDGDRDLEAGDSKPVNQIKEPAFFEEKYLVIMAGQANPTFLATPITSTASSFGGYGCRCNLAEKTSTSEKVKEESSDHLEVRTTENNGTQDQLQ